MSRELNIVVFGSTGMLGSDLIELFSYEKDIHVRGYVHRECDISDMSDVENILGNTGNSITHCINCSAFTDVDACESNPDRAYKVNAFGPRNLAEVCFKEQIHLTHISTDYVFEGLKKEPYLEQDETTPLSVYGRTKLEGEGPVRALGNKGLVIRTAWLYGKHRKNFVDNVHSKLELGVDVKTVDDQFGSPTYTMDLSNAIIQLVIGNKSGLFHVANSGSCSWYEFALKIAEFTKLKEKHVIPISMNDLERKANRPKYSVLSTNRLDRTLPEPIRSWENGLYQYLLETKRVYEF